MGFPSASWLSVVLVLIVPVGGCISAVPNPTGSPPPLATGRADVVMQNTAFSPNVLRVAVGTQVTWTNKDPYGHTVTPADQGLWGSEGSGDKPSQWLAQGTSWSFTFTKPGTYLYYCIPHSTKGANGAVSGMVATIIVADARNRTNEVGARVVPNPVAPPPTGRTAPTRVAFTLQPKELEAQLAEGVSYEFWTFNATVPGPMLRVHVNDTVNITIDNPSSNKHPHSIDLHAVNGPGGGSKVTQTPPGQSSHLEFKALNPGLYVYHCATPHVPTHIANGMYGLILVEPDIPLPRVDHEYFVVQGEVYTAGGLTDYGKQNFSLEKLEDERPEYFIFNGRVGALTGEGALKARVNESVRLYVGVGTFVPSSFHVIGEVFDRVYAEGALADPVRNVQTTLIPAGGTAVVELTPQEPGDYLLVDHTLTRAIDRGAIGILHVEGEYDPSVYAPQGQGGGSGH